MPIGAAAGNNGNVRIPIRRGGRYYSTARNGIAASPVHSYRRTVLLCWRVSFERAFSEM